MKPKISVVLTTYQRPKMLERAIKSIRKQSFKDFELIIVDDASVDDTDLVVNKYIKKDSRIRYIKREANFGTHSRPKNEGTQAAKADYIAYFDDDNVMLPSHLAVLYKYITDADTDIVYGQSIIIDDDGRNEPRLAITSDINDSKGINIYEQNFIDTNQVIIKKEALEKIGGWDETCPRYADWNLFVRLKKAGLTFLFVPSIITEYHVHEGMNQMKHKFMFDTRGCKIWPDKTLYGDRKKLKVAVYTLTMNRLDYTQRSFKALREKTSYPYDHFVVDNGSTDGTVEWLKEHESAFKKVIYNKKNVGISKASNQAVDAMGKEYDIIIKVDNDIEMWNNQWLEMMVDLYERNDRLVVSPVIEGLIDTPGGVPRQLGYTQVGPHFLGMVPHIGGAFCAAPLSLYEIFRWREEDYLHAKQDWIFSQFAQRVGYTCAYLEPIRAEHIDTTEGQKKRYKEYFEKRKEERRTKYEKSN